MNQHLEESLIAFLQEGQQLATESYEAVVTMLHISNA